MRKHLLAALCLLLTFAAMLVVLPLVSCSSKAPAVLPGPPSTPTTTRPAPITVAADLYWPPLFPSGFRDITGEMLKKYGTPKLLGNVGDDLASLLGRSGYSGSTFCQVPEGFALVTPLERINADGSPDAAQRFDTTVSPFRGKNILDYFAAIEGKGTVTYRVIVFIVTPWPLWAAVDLGNSGSSPDGGKSLPPEVASLPWSSDCRCVALIYEFSPTAGINGQPGLIEDGRLSGQAHLEKSGIWANLGGE